MTEEFEARIEAVLGTMRRMRRAIWVGDLAQTPAETEMFRLALRELLRRGQIVRHSSKHKGRAYFKSKEE